MKVLLSLFNKENCHMAAFDKVIEISPNISRDAFNNRLFNEFQGMLEVSDSTHLEISLKILFILQGKINQEYTVVDCGGVGSYRSITHTLYTPVYINQGGNIVKYVKRKRETV